MSTALLVAIGVAVLAFAFWHRLAIRRALGFQHLVGTGHAFLVLGALAGLLFEPAQAERLVGNISPLLALAAGWVGFATAMRFERKVLALVPRRALLVALVPALVTAVLVGGALAAVLLVAGFDAVESIAIAGILGSAAGASGSTVVAVLRRRRAGRAAKIRPLLRMIELSAGLDAALVIVAALLLFSLARPATGESVSPPTILAIAAGGSMLLALVTWLLLGGSAGDSERLLLGIGILVFAAGFGDWLLVSPAVITAIVAAVLTNLPGGRFELLWRAVRRVERPAVVLLMLFVGFAAVGPLHWVVVPMFLAMTGLRLAGKWWGGSLVASDVGAPGLSAGPGWGLGLVAPSNLGLIVVLSLMTVWGDELARSALAATAAASLVNELVAPRLLARLVRRGGPGR